MLYDNDDPIISNVRKGDSTSPYKYFEEPLIVDNSGKVLLTERPNKFNKVRVFDSNGNYMYETTNEVPDENSFLVDYDHKTVTFNIANIGKQFIFKYYGEGNSYFPATSIYTERDGLTVIETLDSLTTTTREARDEAKEMADYAKFEGDRVDSLVDNTKYINPYNATTQYKKNNMVAFNGSSFIAKQDTLGNPPPTEVGVIENDWWALLSRKGADGDGTVSVYKETFIASEGQKVFKLKYNFDQFQNRATVTVGGVLQYTPDNYEEISSNSISFYDGLPAGYIVEVTYFGAAVPLTDDIVTVVNNHSTEINTLFSEVNNINNTFAKRATVPATPVEIGNVGEWAVDSNYLYICVATNSWKRTKLDIW